MVQEVLFELVKGIGRFFLHPAVYITLLFSILIGYVRVKRERRQFRTRLLWGWTEAKGFLLEGIVWALILSVISVALGLVIPSSWLLIYSVWMLLFILLFTETITKFYLSFDVNFAPRFRNSVSTFMQL